MNFQISDKVKYLNKVLCEVQKIYQALLTSKKLSDSEYVLLFSILEQGEGCLQKDITENSYINKKTINSTVKKLQQKGLIELKSGKYPNMHIFLTPKGQEYVQSNIIPIIETENLLMQNVEDKDFTTFVDCTAKYIDSFKEHISLK